jgi:ADP-ribose pyrophosphatase
MVCFMQERTLSTSNAFSGRLLTLDIVEVELGTGERAEREIVRHPGAAVVLAQLDDGRFVFVRQYRKAIERLLLEVVAGTLEPGEDPEACAMRELVEETGHPARTLERLGTVYPAPGYTEECLHVYFARIETAQVERNLDDDERIDVVYLTQHEIDKMIASAEIEDAKTLSAWMLYKSRVVA